MLCGHGARGRHHPPTALPDVHGDLLSWGTLEWECVQAENRRAMQEFCCHRHSCCEAPIPHLLCTYCLGTRGRVLSVLVSVVGNQLYQIVQSRGQFMLQPVQQGHQFQIRPAQKPQPQKVLPRSGSAAANINLQSTLATVQKNVEMKQAEEKRRQLAAKGKRDVFRPRG